MNEHSPVLTSSFRTDMDPAKRQAYVQKWIARNQRRLSAGLGATVLTLPLLAQAQSAEGLVNALDIAGVRSVALNPDGSAQLTLANGQQVQVAASSVQTAADGTVLVSAAAAEMVAEVVTSLAVAGATGAGAGAGLGGAGIAAAVGGLGLAAAAAGGGSSSGSSPAIPVLNASDITPSSLQNVAAAFGSLPELEPGDSLFLTIGDGAELNVTIGADGSLVFPNDIDLDQFQGQQTLSYRVQRTTIVEGEDEDGNPTSETVTEDVASGSAVVRIDTIPPEIEITAISAGDVLNAAEQGEALTIEGTATGAENGQQVSVTFKGQTYTTTVTDEAWSLSIPAADLAGLADGASLEITANVADAAGNPAEQATATLATDFTAEIAIAPVVIETLNSFIGVEITGTTDGVEEGRTVTVNFNGTDYTTATGADGGWSVDIPAAVIDALEDAANVTISASASDEAGNPATATTNSTTDFSTPALAITSPASGSFLNAETITEDLEISGIAIEGSLVTVTLPGAEPQTVTADANSSWTVTFPASDLPATEGPLAINATTELGGTPINAPPVTLTIDTTPPVIAITTPIAGDDMINAAERDADLSVSGTTDAENGQTVTLRFNGNDYMATVQGGAWSATIPASALSGLEDDESYTISATVSDAAGNEAAAPATAIVSTDFTPPAIAISAFGGIAAGGTLTAADLLDGNDDPVDNLALTGTTDAPDGTEITVSFGAATLTTTATGAAWSLDIPAATVTAQLASLDAVTISASAEDAAGNTGTGTLPLEVDLSVPSIALTTPEGGAVLGLDAFEEGLTISGTTENVTNGQTVTIELRQGETVVATTTGTVTDDAFTGNFAAATIQGLDDQSSFTLGVSVTDPSFPVPATASATLNTDIQPEITLDPIGVEGALILADIANEVTFSGTTRGVQQGQEVTLFLDEGNGPELIDDIGPILVQSDGSWSVTVQNPNLDDVDPGQEFSFSAQVSNTSGRAAPEASEQVVAYQASVFTAVYAGADNGILDFFIFTELDNVSSGGISRFQFNMEFDPEIARLLPAATEDIEGELVASGGMHSTIALGERNPNEAPDGSTDVFGVRLLGQITNFDSEPLYVFQMEDLDPESVIGIYLTGAKANDIDVGPSVSFTGTEGDDTITAANIDTAIRGSGGDDQIDVSAPGVNTVIFEGGSIANGFDTITGFTLGGALADRFAIAFDTFDQDVLRGDGSAFQVTSGGAVGADVGLVVFSTAVADFDNATIEAALDDLTGLNDGDSLYVLIGDGTDAVLTAFEIAGSELSVRTGSGTSYAEFKDIGDLSGFSSANILGFEQHML